MMRRELHQLPAVKWVVRIVVTDQPGPGEDYVSKESINAHVLGAGTYSEGLSVEVQDIQQMHGYSPAGKIVDV